MTNDYFFNQEPNPAVETYKQDVRARKKTFARAGWALMVLLLVTYVMQYALIFALGWLWPEALTTWWVNWVLSFVPLYLFGLPAFLLTFVGIDRGERCNTYVSRGAVLPKPKFKFYHFLLWAVIGFGLLYIGNTIGTTMMNVLSAITGYDYQNALASIVDTSPMWMTFLGTVILAPIGEELLFRKILIDRTRDWGDVASILLSAIAFGMFHGNFFQFFYAFLLGLVLAYLYTWTGNVWWSVGLHMFINLVGSILMPALTKVLGLDGDISQNPLSLLGSLVLGMGIVMLMGAAVLLLVLLFCLRKVYLGKGNRGVGMSFRDKLISTVGTPGIWVAFVLYGILLLLSLLPLA